ncbi:hypothetical protein EF888_15060 [Silicimonas algicola]|uniref:MaoC dehydratase-like protein n=1 Tax=Silicimonas algicola TaxID=1826607 RepID=A0A316FYU7_9RHOB|nr:MaoC family dehydratase N-terminal domain-containing protein [Silicimonas algicola]AZQ68337.1 hypothetical protein EF888_15060 [Silicimonas algicola]PWK53593.1 MaoC dehydratase-like protein [Silicimonas algicola]
MTVASESTDAYLTDEIRVLVGQKSEWMRAPHPVEGSEVRRFFHATMELHAKYIDDDWAAQSRYRKRVAPIGFPVHAFRRGPLDTDPLERMDDPDFDGVSRSFRPGLPPVPIPLPGILNGGYEYELYSHVHHGEEMLMRSNYASFVEREGRSGRMVFIAIEDEFRTAEGRPLLHSVNTMILR